MRHSVKATIVMVTLVLLLAVVAIANSTERVIVRKSAPVVVRQQPNVLYLIGSEFRYQSFEERLREIIRQEIGGDQSRAAAKPPSAVAVACGRCHSGETVKGGFRIDPAGIEAKSVTKAIRQLASGSMPPDRQLTREEKNDVLQSLLDIEFAEAEPVATPPTPIDEGVKP